MSPSSTTPPTSLATSPSTAASISPYDFPLASALPFLLLLLAIAVLPHAVPRWWHRDRNRALVAGLLAAPVAVLLIAVAPGALAHSALEYLSFIVLLGSLFTVSGGIALYGDLEATPRVNAAFLAIGAVIANLVGTAGASMLLLPPLLRTNRERARTAHIPLFFILIVSNAGGMLSPLGDPPLFLGYLRGVPFFWTLRLLPVWTLSVGWLLAVFLIADSVAYSRESAAAKRADRRKVEPLRVRGLRNVAILAVVAASALLPSPSREIVMVTMAVLSYFATPRGYHAHNELSFAPMSEVAILFAGIFVTMVPALEMLRRHGSSLGIDQPWQFFWLTGLGSSVLDNAPTYLTFLSLAQGLAQHGSASVAAGGGAGVVVGSVGTGVLAGGGADLVAGVGVPHAILQAIAAGAVLMGANTYIGNGPNFMVKAIAERRGIAMPGFFGFAFRSLLILLPLYLALTFLVFR